MKEINKIFERLGKKIYKCGYEKGNKIVEADDGKYVIKNKCNNKAWIYDYLRNRGFTNFLEPENNYDDSYEIYRYLDDNMSISDKAVDLVYILSILHTKTTTYQEVVLDKVKEVYEKFNEELEYLNIYYHQMQDYIEAKVYMAPAEYLLIRNMSLIYELLNISKTYLESWYSIKIKNKKERVVFIHDNLSIDSFINSNNLILKDWDKAHKDWVIYDFYKLYRNNYKDLEFESLFDIYQSKYKFTHDELLLFLALISKMWKVDFRKSNYDNCIMVNNLVIYLNKTKSFISKYNKENKKTDEEKFSQEYNNV